MDFTASEVDSSLLSPIATQSSPLTKPISYKPKAFALTYNFALLLLLVYFVLLTLKLDQKLTTTFSWSYLTISFCFSTLLLCFAGLCFISFEQRKILNPGRCILQTAVVIYSLCLLAFQMLLNFQLDKILSTTYGVIFTPIFIILGLTMFLICFLFPVVVQKDLKDLKSGVLMIIDFVLASCFIIMLCLKLDHVIEWKVAKIFALILAPLGLHLIFIVIEAKQNGVKKTMLNSMLLFGLTFICTFIILHFAGITRISWFITLGPIFVGIISLQIFAVKLLINAFKHDNE